MITKIDTKMNFLDRNAVFPGTNPKGSTEIASGKRRRSATRRRIYITDLDHHRLQTMIEKARVGLELLPDYLVALQGELERACVVSASSIPHNVVTMNSTASVCDLETNEVETYTLVYPEQADIGRGRISVLAPVGTALLGYRVGDIVEWPVPAGVARFRIEAICFQPEQAGEQQLRSKSP